MHSEDATLMLATMTREDGEYSAKIPWVSKPDYTGAILIRGRRLDAKGTIRFSAAGPKFLQFLDLSAPNDTDSAHWSFWPTGMYLPGPGCYGLQIDTSAGSDTVIFSANN
jgi:hypothetical protein